MRSPETSSEILVPLIPYEERKEISSATAEELLELHRLLRSAYPHGCCVLGSNMLIARYKHCRKVPLEYGELTHPSGDTQHHSWVVCVDGTIVDITADQFGIPGFGPVVYLAPTNPQHRWYKWWRE